MILIQGQEQKYALDRAHRLYLERKFGEKVIQRQASNKQEDVWERGWKGRWQREWENGFDHEGREIGDGVGDGVGEAPGDGDQNFGEFNLEERKLGKREPLPEMRKLPWGSGHTKYKPILNPLKVKTTTTTATRRSTSPLAQLVFPADIKNPSLPLSTLLQQQNTTATASETAPSPLVSSSSASLGIRDLVQEVQQVDKQALHLCYSEMASRGCEREKGKWAVGSDGRGCC
jgi:hypothetical protein